MADEAKPEQIEEEIQAKNEAEIQQMIDKDNAEEAAELEEVAAQKIVSEGDKPPMSGAMQAQKMAAMDKKEDEAELKKIEEMDAVNEESKAVVGDLFAKAVAKKAEKDEEEIQAQIDIDNAEEAAELEEVAAKKIVSENAAPPMSGAMQAAKMAAMDKKEDQAELKKIEEMDAVNEESKAAVGDLFAKVKAKKAEKDEAEIQQMIDMDNKEEQEELDAIKEQKIVSEKMPMPAMPGAMQAAKMAAMDKKEDEAELKQIAEMDAVNEESKAVVGDLFAKVKAKKAEKDEADIQEMIDKDNAEEAAELDEVAEAKKVSNAPVIKMSDAMIAQKQANMDKKEDKAELKQIEEMDAVNEESKAVVGDLFAKVKAKKAEKDEAAIQEMIDKDNAEEAAELEEVAEAKKVSNAPVIPMSGAMQAAKMAAMDKKEDEAELKNVEAMDAVNEESKAAVANILAVKKAKKAEMEAEEEVEAADEPKPQYIKMDNVSINVEVKEAMDDLYKKGSVRRHVMIRIDEKKKKKKRSYYAELASTGEGCLQPVIDTIASDLNTIFFAAFRVDCSDAANSKRQKYVWSQIQGNIDQIRAAKLMSYSKDINDLAKKQDCTIRSVTHENYQTEFSMENLSQALHGKAAHPPDQYDFGAGMVIQMKN